MATDYTVSVRSRLVSLFSQDPTLQGFIGAPGRVFDNVPAKTPFPYLRVGDADITDFGTKTEPGQEFNLDVHVLDRSSPDRGQKTINLIQARIYALLHEQALSLPSGSAYLCRFVRQVTNNTDGLSWHGISRYRVLVE